MKLLHDIFLSCYLNELSYGLHFKKWIFFVFHPFSPAPTVYGGSQARGLIGAVAASLHHSHRNARS